MSEEGYSKEAYEKAKLEADSAELGLRMRPDLYNKPAVERYKKHVAEKKMSELIEKAQKEAEAINKGTPEVSEEN